MIPLFLLSVTIYYYGSEMIIFLNRFSSLKKISSDLNKWISNPSKAPDQIKQILEYTQYKVSCTNDLRYRVKQIEQFTYKSIEKKLIEILCCNSSINGPIVLL